MPSHPRPTAGAEASPDAPKQHPSDAIRPLGDRARRLAEKENFREAVDLLSDADPAELDGRLLRDLVRWRSEAFEDSSPRPDWPPSLPDPFPQTTGLPEVDATDLTSDVIGGAILHHGALLVRDMVSSNQASDLADIVTGAFEAVASEDEDSSPWYEPFDLPAGHPLRVARHFGSDQTILTGDSPRALADFLSFLKDHEIVSMIEDYLGEPAYLSMAKSALRCVPPDSSGAWHQDGAFLGPEVRTVNCWLALSDCGDGKAPGMDVFPHRLEECVEMGSRGAFAWWAVGEEVVDELAAEKGPVASPEFKAGDALLFDQMCLHSTGVRSGLTEPRLAIESWFFAGSTFPEKHLPLAI